MNIKIIIDNEKFKTKSRPTSFSQLKEIISTEFASKITERFALKCQDLVT